MTDLWVRQVASDADQARYRWYECKSGEQGDSSLTELATRWREASVTLLISGVDCPTRRLTFKPEEKRHLARLVPYELEAELAQDIAGLHVALGTPVSGSAVPDLPEQQGPARTEPEVLVSYMDRRILRAAINALENASFDVRHCYAEPLLLSASATSWTLRLVDGQVDISWGQGNAASMELSMLPVFLDSLQQSAAAMRATVPQTLRLQAQTDDELETLQARLSATAPVQSWQPELITSRLNHIWQGLHNVETIANAAASKVAVTIPDLRQGVFARPVRWQKYWRPLRLPLVAAGVAALTFAAVTLLETQINNQRFRAVQQSIESVYREVVPGGVLVDAEQQLRAQLSQLRGDFNGGSVLALLNRITPQLSQHDQISITRLNYSGANSATAQGELQLSVEAASNTDILQFSEQLNNLGLLARAQNLTQSGNRQQASMIITETSP